jgi:hypothetical protein
LDCGHHVSLLRQKCVSQIGCPLNVAGHACHHVRKHDQRLDTWVPRLLCDGIRQRLPCQILVLVHPLLKLNDLKRISGSSERLSQEIIRIERDRRDERIQLSSWEYSSLLIVRRGRHLLRLRLLRECGGTQRETNDGYHTKK